LGPFAAFLIRGVDRALVFAGTRKTGNNKDKLREALVMGFRVCSFWMR
jgi:hypothetical protein